MNSDLTAVSLFGGIEGFGLALRRNGIHLSASVEIDPDCRGVVAHHFPRTHFFNDVAEVTGDQLRAAGFVPDRGIICAGWPCQGNSVAGGRGGMADPRSGLWRHVVRLLAETRPAWFLGENVPGLLSVNDGEDIAVVRRDLAQLGYWWTERILDSQHFGVAQRRRRVFFVGCAGDGLGPVEVLLEPEGGEGHPAAGRPTRQSASRRASGSAGGPGTAAPLTTRPYADQISAEDSLITGVIPVQDGRDMDKQQNGLGVGAPGEPSYTVDTTGAQAVATLQGGGRRGHRIDAEGAAGGHLIALEIADTLRSHPRPGSNSSGAIVSHPITSREAKRSADSDATNGLILAPAQSVTGQVTHALTAEGADASEDGTGRGTPLVTMARPVPSSLAVAGDFSSSEDLAQTVRAANGQPGCVAAGLAVRRLTPKECERLQDFPDDWTRWKVADGQLVEQSDSARYRQIGNAVTVSVPEWIIRRLVAADLARSGKAGAA